MVKTESELLKGWKLKIGILMAVIIPSVSVTAGVYNLKFSVEDRINQVEKETHERFVEKDDFKELRNDVKELRQEIQDLKVIMLRRTR